MMSNAWHLADDLFWVHRYPLGKMLVGEDKFAFLCFMTDPPLEQHVYEQRNAS